MKNNDQVERRTRGEILTHLEISDNNPDAICLWKGYISGLLEWGVIDKEAFIRLFKLLPGGPEDQVMHEIFHID